MNQIENSVNEKAPTFTLSEKEYKVSAWKKYSNYTGWGYVLKYEGFDDYKLPKECRMSSEPFFTMDSKAQIKNTFQTLINRLPKQ